MIVEVFVGVWCRSTREHKTWWFKNPVHCYFCTLHGMCPYYLYRYQKVLKFAPMLEGLLHEVVCKEELKRTITHDFMYISVVLGFFWTTLYIMRYIFLVILSNNSTRLRLGPLLDKMTRKIYLIMYSRPCVNAYLSYFIVIVSKKGSCSRLFIFVDSYQW